MLKCHCKRKFNKMAMKFVMLYSAEKIVNIKMFDNIYFMLIITHFTRGVGLNS